MELVLNFSTKKLENITYKTTSLQQQKKEKIVHLITCWIFTIQIAIKSALQLSPQSM